MNKLFRVGYYRKISSDKSVEYSKPKKIDREIILPLELYNLVVFPDHLYSLNVYDSENLSAPPKNIFVMKRKNMPDVTQNCKTAVDNILRNYDNLVANGKQHVEITNYIFYLVSLYELIYRVYKDNGTVYLTVLDV